MVTPPLNLIDAYFQQSNLFHSLPVFDSIHYQGHPDGKIQLYKAFREGQECKLLALSIIRREEDFLWESAEDFLERSVKEASARVHGIFTFDLLTFDIHKEINTFNYGELQALLITHSRKVQPGGERLIKYSSAYGILKKMVAEEWGKITLKTSVEVFKEKPSFLYLLLKRLFKLAPMPQSVPLIVLVNDLSSEPIYDPQDAEQKKRLASVLQEQSKSAIEFLPEIYLQNKNGVRELLSDTEIK